MRRCRLILSLVAVLVLPPAGAVAQANPFADLGLPELKIKLTDAGSAYVLRLDGVPTETPAGRYQVSSTNDVREPIGPIDDPQPVELAVTFLQLPEDMTVEDFTALFAGPTPSEDSFAFLYETYLAGGPGALQGETTQGVINLIPGDYAVATYGLAAKAMTVTDGDVASPGAREIAASATIIETGTSGSFAFEVTSLTPGPGVLEIRNDSDQPHLVFGIRSEAPITGDEVLTILMEEEGEGSGAQSPTDLAPALLIGIQSPDTIQYLAIDLQPGYYALLCLVGDPEQGSVVHALEGMIDVVAAAASIRSKVAGHGNDRPEGRSSAVPRLGWISAGQRLTRRCATPRGRM